MDELKLWYKKLIHTITTSLSVIPPLWRLIMVLILLSAVAVYIVVLHAPAGFPVNTVITVSEGSTLNEIADSLVSQYVIRSSSVFKGIIFLAGGQRNIFAGDYFFNDRKNVLSVARKLIKADFGLEPIRITFPEGVTVADIGKILSLRLGSFDEEKFVALAKKKEGYLFPDTYFLLPTVKERKVVALMEETFDERILEVQKEIREFGRPLEEVIIMASLLEKEARLMGTRQIISGILWKRLDEEILLQVDAVFLYINGKNTFQLTFDDLIIDSPYNTYKYKGLPVGPIANPGLDAITAAITPIETDYYFYLSDKNGVMYYSATFDEHKRKKQIYLN